MKSQKITEKLPDDVKFQPNQNYANKPNINNYNFNDLKQRAGSNISNFSFNELKQKYYNNNKDMYEPKGIFI